MARNRADRAGSVARIRSLLDTVARTPRSLALPLYRPSLYPAPYLATPQPPPNSSAASTPLRCTPPCRALCTAVASPLRRTPAPTSHRRSSAWAPGSLPALFPASAPFPCGNFVKNHSTGELASPAIARRRRNPGPSDPLWTFTGPVRMSFVDQQARRTASTTTSASSAVCHRPPSTSSTLHGLPVRPAPSVRTPVPSRSSCASFRGPWTLFEAGMVLAVVPPLRRPATALALDTPSLPEPK